MHAFLLSVLNTFAIAVASSVILKILVKGILIAMAIVTAQSLASSDFPFLKAIFNPNEVLIPALATLGNATGPWGAYILSYTNILSVLRDFLVGLSTYIVIRKIIPGL